MVTLRNIKKRKQLLVKALKTLLTSERNVFILFVLMVTVVYGRVIGFGFSPMDEEWMVLKNEGFLKEWESILYAFKEPTGTIYYRPLLLITFIIDYHVSGILPWMFHLTNIIMHVFAVWLLYKVLKQYGALNEVAVILASLFVIHPAIIHAVVWVPGRNDLMLALFTLLALYFQNEYYVKAKNKHLVFLMLFFVAALFSKENAIVLPFVFVTNHFIWKDNIRSLKWPFVISMVSLTALWFYLRSSIVEVKPNYEASFVDQVMYSFRSLIVFVGKTLVPVQQSVYPTLKNAWLWPGIITIAIFLFVLFKLHWKSKKIALFGIFFFVIMLAIPVWFNATSVNREQYEHRLYVPLMGLMIAATQLQIKLDHTRTKTFLLALASIYLYLNFTRANSYKDQLSFIERAVEECPDNYFFQFRMADHLFAEKNYKGAIEHYTEAIALQPSKGMFFNNRANAYTAIGNKAAALRDFDSAIVRSNNAPGVYINRMATLVKFNEIELAMSELKKLKACCQNMIPPEMEQEIMYKWNVTGFKKINEKLITQPNNPILYANRAKLFFDRGMLNESIADLEKACSLDPANAELKKYLEMLKSAAAGK
jgi:tetratricopeptide (TPR) repeat protein